VEYSGHQKSTVYLAPPGDEPQQRIRHSPHPTRNSTRGVRPAPTHVSSAYPVPKDIIKHQYASDNILQYYEAYIPEINQRNPQSAKYWVIFIHGGYYRDTNVQAASFHRALASLISNPLYLHLRNSITGFASINYRLSAHPDHPQNPEKTPAYEMHTAKHPDHINDVIAGLAELQRKYGFGSNYLLAGHSVGATLAFQVALSQQTSWQPPSDSSGSVVSTSIEPPSGILGLNGIYSFPALHESFPSYVGMTSGALGSDAKVYSAISPASYRASTYASTWNPSHGRQRIIILAASPQDTLVDNKQVEVMLEAIKEGAAIEEATAVGRRMSTATAFSDATTINPATASNTLHRVTSNPEFNVQTLQLKGDHDFVWQSGEGLARAIALVAGQMKRAEREEGEGGGEARDFGAA
jgi:pimeloyl-ACP methyl ester carboxylesterase